MSKIRKLWQTRADRLRADFQETFGTESGQRVLLWLYEHLHGKQTTFPQSGKATELAFNEGRRSVWLQIMEHLREEDMDIRRAWEKLHEGKRMEEMNE